MDYAIEILKDLFYYFCENNNIEKKNVDYITYIIVTFMWIQKLFNYSISNKPAKNNTINLINLFKKEYNFNRLDEEEDKEQQYQESLQLIENENYIKKLEHENKQLNDYVDTLKNQIENIDDLNIQLQEDVNLKLKENEM